MAGTSIISLMPEEGSAIFFQDSFRNELEKHLSVLRTDLQIQMIDVPPNIALRYNADFDGLMCYYKIPAKYHWVIMRINNMLSTFDYRPTMLTLLIPDFNFVEQLKTTFTTVEKSL